MGRDWERACIRSSTWNFASAFESAVLEERRRRIARSPFSSSWITTTLDQSLAFSSRIQDTKSRVYQQNGHQHHRLTTRRTCSECGRHTLILQVVEEEGIHEGDRVSLRIIIEEEGTWAAERVRG